jgi:hypothetical protein
MKESATVSDPQWSRAPAAVIFVRTVHPFAVSYFFSVAHPKRASHVGRLPRKSVKLATTLY